jgi:SAM-dependent methyltransferase
MPAHIKTGRHSRRAKYFLKFDRLVNRALNAIRAIHQGFWLGIMDREQYMDIVGSMYTDWKSYHDADYNQSGFWPWEAEAIDRYFSESQSILIGAAGGGREMIALSQRGYQVVGFDCFPDFISSSDSIFASLGLDTRLTLAEPDHVPAELGVYDSGIVGWSGYSHICGSSRRVNFLREFRSHLKAGGPLLLSFFALPADSYQFKLVYYVARVVKAIRLSREKVEPGDILIDMFFHYASEDEVRREMDEAGFKTVHFSLHSFGHAIGIAV